MKKVLLFDDDRYFCDDFSSLMEIEGIKCEIKNSADQLFDIVNKLDSYDVIFLDIMLRKGSHQELNKDLETGEIFYNIIRDKYPRKLIVILSAKNKKDIKIDLDNPFTKYIQKPLSSSISEVFSVINEV